MSLRKVKSLLAVVFLILFSTSVAFGLAIEAKAVESNIRLVQIQCLRSDSEDEHLFLEPQQSLTFSANDEIEGLKFVSIHVQANSTNQFFLRQLNSTLFIESYDYFGGLGGWTSNNNFTLTNPTTNRQELFLRITRNYMQVAYAEDKVLGQSHTIEFTSGPSANRVFVRWGVFAALKYLEINQTEVNLSNIESNLTQVRLEFLPTYASFQLPSPLRIEGTRFLLQLEEEDVPTPSGFCYISAFKLDHKEIVLGPYQQVLFETPAVNGWNFLAAAAYTNLTSSLFPKPYPFELINLAIWDSNANPMLVTATDTLFGIKNLSNVTYSLGIDVVYYYWQNQSGLTFEHEVIDSNESSIIRKISVNISEANVGTDLGLTGQFLRFQLPGKTVSFDAPDLVGKYEDSYIPLRHGEYVLVKRDNRIIVNTTSKVDDLHLTNRLRFVVTYDGEAYANAEVTVNQRGVFTSRTYNAITDQNGWATVVVSSNGPEFSQLEIIILKDDFNRYEQMLSYFAGALWVFVIVLVVVLVVVLSVLLIQKRRCRGPHKKVTDRESVFPKTL